jgi:hypothetical protein
MELGVYREATVKTSLEFMVSCVLLISASPLCAQRVEADSACGLANVIYDSKLANQQARPEPKPDEALVYFEENNAGYVSVNPPTTRIGIDGRWAGAMQEVSWFYAYVDPGPHHLCANWQTSLPPAWTRTTQTTPFTARAGGTYYFEVKYEDIAHQVKMELIALDPHDGARVIRKYFYCTSELLK